MTTPIPTVNPTGAPILPGQNLGQPSTLPTPTPAPAAPNVANQGKPGFDVFGNPVAGTPVATGGANSTNPGTPAAPVVTTGAPTVGSIYGNDPYSASNQNTAEKASSDFATNGLSADDQAQIRASTLASFQAEIDAQNSVYADKLAQAKITGANRLGSTTAVEARRGLIGSDFGNAQTDTTNNANDAVYSSINDEKNAAISAILTQSNTDATKAIQDKTTAKQAGLDSYVKYLQDGATRAQTGATTAATLLLNNKTDPSTLTPDQLQTLLDNYGITKEALTSAYTTAKQTADTAAATAAKAGQTVLSPGQTIIGPDGKVIASSAPKDTYTVVKGTKTTDAFGNESISPDKVFDSTTGKYVGTTSDSSGGGSSSSSNANLPSPTNTTGSGSSKLSFDQYGLLANTDFNPDNQVDALAQKYLDTYIKNGTVPTASTLGRAIKPAAMAQIDQRARDLYYKATGNPLPTPQILKAQQDIISSNYKLGNNLAIQEGTVSANVDLSLANMTKNGLNSSGFKPLDDLIDNVKAAFQDPNVGQMIAQNSTIQNEVGSLLSIKNAAGTTVYDKLTSGKIIGKDDSPEVIQQKVTALLQEAKNFASSLTSANAAAYKFTDPLLQDSNNPLRATAQVGSLLDKQGIDYNDLIKQMQVSVPRGTQPAIDAKTGAPVYATPAEISSGKYLAL